MSEPGLLTTQRAFDAPMTIGVISDTHIYPGSRRELPRECLALFRRFRCGLILHAGDCNTLHTLQLLADVAPLLAVAGNTDDWDFRDVVPDEVEFTVGKYRIGLLHGNGKASARVVATKRFAGKADLVVYGHSHNPIMERVEGTLFFNPGSATDRRRNERFSIGIVTIDEVRIWPELILFKEPRELASIKPD